MHAPAPAIERKPLDAIPSRLVWTEMLLPAHSRTASSFLLSAPPPIRKNLGPDPLHPKAPSDAISKKDADPETELQKAIADAGNDRSALVRNLKNYLKRFPDAPRKAAVYRALVESCQQVQDNACALQYAEQLIAVRPDDSEIMMLAVGLLAAARR